MITLRWILGIVAAVFGGGFLILAVVAGGFRRSFGASESNPLLMVLPVAAAGLLLVALILPSNRVILHAAGACAIVLVAVSIWQIIAEGASVLWFALIYLALWFVFYWQTAFGASAPR